MGAGRELNTELRQKGLLSRVLRLVALDVAREEQVGADKCAINVYSVRARFDRAVWTHRNDSCLLQGNLPVFGSPMRGPF